LTVALRPIPPAARRGLARRPLVALLVVLALALLVLAGCSSLGYVSQAAWGQARILAAKKPIERLVADPGTAPELRAKLRAVERIRAFAVAELGLPAKGYRSYVELPRRPGGERRRYVTWNVVAAPELSTVPLTWCFPIAGCVSYRGYFSERRARRFAARLERRGFDVAVTGAVAYSTLGYFADPVLSTVIDYPEVDLAGLLFHELAHQRLYLPGDTAFNESFATAVEVEGVRRWLRATGGDPSRLEAYLERLRRQDRLISLLTACRQRLQAVYDEERPAAWKRRRKAELFAQLRRDVVELKRSRGGPPAADDPWLSRPLNNADLAATAPYHDLVPAFRALLAEQGGDLTAFYDAANRLAGLPPDRRRERLAELRAAAQP